jgi:hypothetical protein
VRAEAERPEWIARCEQIELLQRDVLAKLGASIDADYAARASEYLDHNELGLAIETILMAVAGSGTAVDDVTGAAIDRAAQEMHGEEGLWRLPVDRLVERLIEKGFT